MKQGCVRTWRETLGLLKKKLRLLSFSWIQTGECWTFFFVKNQHVEDTENVHVLSTSLSMSY